MVSIHTELVKKHKRIVRDRVNALNHEADSKIRLSHRNLNLVLYLNYLRFMNALIKKSKELSVRDGASEIMSHHWKVASQEVLSQFDIGNIESHNSNVLEQQTLEDDTVTQ